MNFSEKKDSFTITLDNFSGPFDLLLQFVKDKKINIHEISITEITNKYLTFIRNESGFTQSSDNTNEQKTKIGLDEISECMLIIALLMEYKCKYLLPQPEDETLKTEEEEIETDLVEHLKEYQIFKEVAFNLRGRKADLAKVYSRYTHEIPQEERKIFLKDISLEDLVSAFQRVYKIAEEREKVFGIEAEEVTIEERIEEIKILLKSKKEVEFDSLFTRYTKIEVILTFLAILELARNNIISIVQKGGFDKIYVRSTES